MKTRRLMQNDANIQTLMRIYVHHAGSQIHSEYSESIAHMCFANSLSAQSWMNIHPSIEERIYEMNPNLVQDIQLENLEKLRNRPLFGLFRSLEEQYADFKPLGLHRSLCPYYDCLRLVLPLKMRLNRLTLKYVRILNVQS
jgi:hypothetical protein